MQVISLVSEILKTVELRNQNHRFRLFGTLTRGAVWTCMNRVAWALPDLARVLRWGVAQGLIHRAEARRMWFLVRTLVRQAAPLEEDAVFPFVRQEGFVEATHLQVLPGLVRPWQEWATEKIERHSAGQVP